MLAIPLIAARFDDDRGSQEDIPNMELHRSPNTWRGFLPRKSIMTLNM